MEKIAELLGKKKLTGNDLAIILGAEGAERDDLFKMAKQKRESYRGNRVHLRGLIEFSNVCRKNCYYCGIRKDNHLIERYSIPDSEILESIRIAIDRGLGSIVLQSGEVSSRAFTRRVSGLLRKIDKMTAGSLGITLSLGEQSEEVYREWFSEGARRYLLRIETTNSELYRKLHPADNRHSFERRIGCLRSLQKTGYQTGTGVMIGLPFQTLNDMADDLIFMKEMDIDMVGMGPYIEHEKTPLYQFRKRLFSKEARLDLSLKMIALTRILMNNINIAATTALQAIDPAGREMAVAAGANIIMPNITPGRYRECYSLYADKPVLPGPSDDIVALEESLITAGVLIAYNEFGDSERYFVRKSEHQDIGRNK